MRKRSLGQFPRFVVLRAPGSERRTEPVHRALDARPIQQRSCRHVTQRLAGRRRKQKARAIRQLPRFGQQLKRPRRQWYPMLTTGLHSLGRYGPHPSLEIHLAPRRQPSLPGSRRCQDRVLRQQLGRRPRVGTPVSWQARPPRPDDAALAGAASQRCRSSAAPPISRHRPDCRSDDRPRSPTASPRRSDAAAAVRSRCLPSFQIGRKHGEHIGAGNVR